LWLKIHSDTIRRYLYKNKNNMKENKE